MRAKITKEGLLIPREVIERLGAAEVEIFEEPGRLLIVAEPASSEDPERQAESGPVEDPILALGSNPVRTGLRDGSTDHDRYLYNAGA